MTPPPDPASRRAALGWAAVGLAAHLALAGGALVRAGGDPAYFVHFGTDYPAFPLARAALGDDLHATRGMGHDGQAFWLLARDPLLRDTDAVRHLDYPVYRAQRVGYPAVASAWHLGGERALLWGLLAANLAAVFAGGYAAARLAAAVGGPARAGLAFALNPGVAAGTLLGVSDVLMLAVLLGCLLAVRRGRPGWAVAAGCLAVLTKQVALAGLVGVAVLAPDVPRRTRVLLVLVPAAAAAAWAVYVDHRLGSAGPLGGAPVFTAPFAGYAEAYRTVWLPAGNWGHAVVAGLVLVAAGVALGRVVRRRTLVLAAAVPFACLVPFFRADVLDLALNPLRVAAPLVTLLLIDLAAGGRGPRRVPSRVALRDPTTHRPDVRAAGGASSPGEAPGSTAPYYDGVTRPGRPPASPGGTGTGPPTPPAPSG
ncbi:MAG: hypothetical protein C0501_13120 [Isosphaera sp.]|nr:hypothetical protein [Isosphaera sp.]